MQKKIGLFLLGDQLDLEGACFEGLVPGRDVVGLAEVMEESEKVWSHQVRTVLFLSAMRHFAEKLEGRGFEVRYVKLDEAENTQSLVGELGRFLGDEELTEVRLVEAGEYSLRESLEGVAERWATVSAERVFSLLEDGHFMASREDFEKWAEGRKQFRMEYFYREMRKRYGYLMDLSDPKKPQPEGGKWNYDAENRKSFGKGGPELLGREGPRFAPDAVTREVMAVVKERLGGNPGADFAALESFNWPVTSEDAERALADFVEKRLPDFGDHQDAMWRDEPWLFHSLVSSSLNLKLLNPRRVCEAAEAAYRAGKAPLAAVEGFVRQVLGWREYVRGLYWFKMPEYLELNALGAEEELPDFYWTGETEFECLRQSVGQTLKFGYAHHIQRLMVTGLFAMLYGVKPKLIHEWYLAVYVDAVEWVELPNVLGMSQWADGGIMASKPYAATGKYIQRMSNYCGSCPRNPALRTGEKACPFTTLYWDFLLQHRPALTGNPRMALQLRNLDRLSEDEVVEIQKTAQDFRRPLS